MLKYHKHRTRDGVKTILNKNENATPELLPSLYKIMQTKNANESVSLCSNNWQCITVKVLRMLSQ